jgi:hypothetical protein
VVLIANDDPIDNFIKFISAETYDVIGEIKFDGTDPNGHHILANGIEQCQFNPSDNKFYLNIPASTIHPNLQGGGGVGPGFVLQISEEAPFRVEKAFTIATSTGCVGPQGLAVGPSNQFALGCGGTNSLVVNTHGKVNGRVVATLKAEGGADETWYSPFNNQYYIARSTAGVLGVANAGPPPKLLTPDTTTGVGSHSVAADPNQNLVFVPIRIPVPGSTSPTICGMHGAVDANGCIATFAK